MVLWIALTSVMNVYALEVSQACAKWCRTVWISKGDFNINFTVYFLY